MTSNSIVIIKFMYTSNLLLYLFHYYNYRYVFKLFNCEQEKIKCVDIILIRPEHILIFVVQTEIIS